MNLPNQMDDFVESLATNTASGKLAANDMNEFVESTDRKANDCIHFGLVFWGLIIAATGVVLTSVITGIVGTLLVSLGLAFFLLQNPSHGRGGL
jgi:hypothetical protein